MPFFDDRFQAESGWNVKESSYHIFHYVCCRILQADAGFPSSPYELLKPVQGFIPYSSLSAFFNKL